MEVLELEIDMAVANGWPFSPFFCSDVKIGKETELKGDSAGNLNCALVDVDNGL